MTILVKCSNPIAPLYNTLITPFNLGPPVLWSEMLISSNLFKLLSSMFRDQKQAHLTISISKDPSH